MRQREFRQLSTVEWLLRGHGRFELPPTTLARPLPVTKSPKHATDTGTSTTKAQRKKARGSKGVPADDTPKAFARLMQFQARGRHPSGLDDGSKSKKRKRGEDEADEREARSDQIAKKTAAHAVPKITPVVSMSEFGARVDMALPVSGLIGKSGKGRDPAGLKRTQTKTEKKMQRMQEQWREEDRRLRERAEAAAEEEWEGDEDDGGVTGKKKGKSKKAKSKTKKSRKAKSGKDGDEDDDDNDDDSDDPWAKINAAARAEQRSRSLHDVVQAPPDFTVRPTERFKKRARESHVVVANVPKSAGSLRKREDLGAAREDVLEAYRAMMQDKRRGGHVAEDAPVTAPSIVAI